MWRHVATWNFQQVSWWRTTSCLTGCVFGIDGSRSGAASHSAITPPNWTCVEAWPWHSSDFCFADDWQEHNFCIDRSRLTSNYRSTFVALLKAKYSNDKVGCWECWQKQTTPQQQNVSGSVWNAENRKKNGSECPSVTGVQSAFNICAVDDEIRLSKIVYSQHGILFRHPTKKNTAINSQVLSEKVMERDS